jgi:hypothetical protein
VRAVLSQPQFSAVIEQVVSQIPPPREVMVLGGVLRDAVLRELLGIEKNPRDIDFLVLGMVADVELKYCFENYQSLSTTTFGGVKLKIEGISVDIWRAEQQIKVAGHLPPPLRSEDESPGEVLKYVTLTTDAIAYHLGRRELYEAGFYSAIDRREIDLGERSQWLPPWVPYHLAHLASVWEVTGFSLSQRVLRSIRETVSPADISQAVSYLEERKRIPDAARVIESLIQEARAGKLSREIAS